MEEIIQELELYQILNDIMGIYIYIIVIIEGMSMEGKKY